MTRDLAFGIKVGSTKLWSALHEVTLRDYQAPAGTVQTPIVNGVGSVQLKTEWSSEYSTTSYCIFILQTIRYNNLTVAENVLAGNGVAFHVTVIVPPGQCNMTVKLWGADTLGSIHPSSEPPATSSSSPQGYALNPQVSLPSVLAFSIREPLLTSHRNGPFIPPVTT